MVYKSMYVHIIIRVLILVGTSLFLSKAVSSSGYVHTAIVLSVLLLLETFELLPGSLHPCSTGDHPSS